VLKKRLDDLDKDMDEALGVETLNFGGTTSEVTSAMVELNSNNVHKKVFNMCWNFCLYISTDFLCLFLL
jgi:hypothetical protein